MNPNEWPHQFTKNGREYQGPNGMLQLYTCIHCGKEYVRGLNSPPPNPCPARNTKREMKRIKLS